MAWNPSPKVADCRDVAKKWGCHQVVIIGVNIVSGTFEVASFGESKALCDRARKINEQISKMLETGVIEIDY